MSRVFLALVSLAAIAVLAILLVHNMDRQEDVDKAISRAEKVIRLANSQTDRAIKAAQTLADRRPAAPRSAPASAGTATVPPPPINMTVTVVAAPSPEATEAEFKQWLRSHGIW